MLLKIIDISECNGKCIYIEECLSVLYGLCYFRINESLNEVYVFFLNLVDFYCIDIELMVKFIKLWIIYFSKFMKVILCGLNFIFFVNKIEVFICLEDFNV